MIKGIYRKDYIPLILIFFGISPILFVSGQIFPIQDSFHIGEHFASAISILNSANFAPITIHGGWDFIPAILSKIFFNDQDFILSTIYISRQLLKSLSIFIAFLLFYKVSKHKNDVNSRLVLLCASLILPWCVTPRDLFLITIVLIIFDLEIRNNGILNKFYTLILIFGTTIGLFWSLDRGLAGLILTVIFFVSNKNLVLKGKLKILSILFFLILISGLILSNYNLINYPENIYMLVKSSNQWTKPSSLDVGLKIIFASLITLSGILSTIGENIKIEEIRKNSLYVTLLICSVLLWKMGINRADTYHIFFTCWCPLLLSSIFFKKTYENRIILFAKNLFSIANFLFLIAFLIKGTFLFAIISCYFCFVLNTEIKNFKIFNSKIFKNSLLILIVGTCFLSPSGPLWTNIHTIKDLKNMSQMSILQFRQENLHKQKLISKDENWAANEILLSSSVCLFDMTNSGIINLVTNLPTCSRITYPIYASIEFEQDLINSLDNEDLNAVVYSTTKFHYSFDNNPMDARFPNLNNQIVEKFPRMNCDNNYCIRYR